MSYEFSIGDKVVDTLSGRIVGRVEYVVDGWAGVRDREGRVDEYPAERLTRAK